MKREFPHSRAVNTIETDGEDLIIEWGNGRRMRYHRVSRRTLWEFERLGDSAGRFAREVMQQYESTPEEDDDGRER